LSDQDSIQNKALSRYLFKISLSVDLAEIIDYQVSFYENEFIFFATSVLFLKREGIQKTDSENIQIPSRYKIGSDPMRDRIMRAARSEPYHPIIDRHPDHCKGNSIPNENHLPPLPETYFPHRTTGRSPSPAPSDAHRHRPRGPDLDHSGSPSSPSIWPATSCGTAFEPGRHA
jgi:hypothetical protein